MWAEISRHLPGFESAVLTGVDDDGYPLSARCHPVPDDAAKVLRVQSLPGTTNIRSGPASLLCHTHDENLWNLKSFLVRGALDRQDGVWIFRPERFIPGAGIGGPAGVARFVFGCRRTARLYLQRRGLARPRIPWDDINAAKEQVAGES